PPPPPPALQHPAQLVDAVRLLRDQYEVGAPGQAAESGDPADAVAHHLDHHDPVMALGRAVQAVDSLADHVHRGVEAVTENEVSGSTSPSISRRKPLRIPSTAMLEDCARRTTARITALRPGQSPPPVRIPTFTNGI